ncbi:MAG: hypothetical protein EA374_06115 [Acholeplasmatales bacterium]|nr:MAG: hypothetical protein EA374_06115 [Acholeplasmatales bacterium]
MSTNEWILIGVAIGVVVISSVVMLLRMRSKGAKERLPEVDALIACFGADNIRSIAFVRSKINVTVKDVITTDMVSLKALGAVGINLVGQRIKFYFEHDNEKIYEALKKTLGEAVQEHA